MFELCLNDRKFVTIQTSDKINVSDTAAQPVRSVLNQFIADRVPKRFIDTLQMTEIKVQYRDPFPAVNLFQYPLKPFAKKRAIGQPGQRIIRPQSVYRAVYQNDQPD